MKLAFCIKVIDVSVILKVVRVSFVNNPSFNALGVVISILCGISRTIPAVRIAIYRGFLLKRGKPRFFAVLVICLFGSFFDEHYPLRVS